MVLPVFADRFDIRVLRQNRRVVQEPGREAELETFHEVLNDVSHGIASNVVRSFILDAYVRGARIGGCAENTDFEGNTAVFTKRRITYTPSFFCTM